MPLTALMSANPAIYIVCASILGLLVGSFINVVIHRLPIMMERRWRHECAEMLGSADAPAEARFDLVAPRSHCPHCGHAISAWENIPLLSYVLLKGRCHGCGAHISLRYPVVELISGLMTATAAWYFGFTWGAAGAMLFGWSVLALTGIDIDQQLLPDDITLPLLWLGLIFNLHATFVDLHSAVLGAVWGYMSLWIIFQVFRKLTGKEGMGFGDFKILAAIGAWLGWQLLPLVVILAAGVGAIVGLSMIVMRRAETQTALPFGPYLAAAGWIALFWGHDIMHAYMTFSGMR